MESNLTLQQLSVYHQLRKSTGVGYILLILLGGFGIHRLWLHHYFSAAAWIVGTFVAVNYPYVEFQLLYIFVFIFELVTFYQSINEYNIRVADKVRQLTN